MKYIICVLEWGVDGLKEWSLKHYTHNLQDAEKWYAYYQKNYSNVRMMVDINSIKNADAKKDLLDLIERMKREAIRKQ